MQAERNKKDINDFNNHGTLNSNTTSYLRMCTHLCNGGKTVYRGRLFFSLLDLRHALPDEFMTGTINIIKKNSQCNSEDSMSGCSTK